jgi:hypothetical protein
VTDVPKPLNDKPRPRTSGSLRFVEILSLTAMITIVAGMFSNCEAWEPMTLRNWDFIDPKVRIETTRYDEHVDVDLAVIAWPGMPWSIMQHLNQRPHQIRNLQLQQEEHKTFLNVSGTGRVSP